MAGVEGLEPPTPGFGDRCSDQLSYTPRLFSPRRTRAGVLSSRTADGCKALCNIYRPKDRACRSAASSLSFSACDMRIGRIGAPRKAEHIAAVTEATERRPPRVPALRRRRAQRSGKDHLFALNVQCRADVAGWIDAPVPHDDRRLSRIPDMQLSGRALRRREIGDERIARPIRDRLRPAAPPAAISG